MVQTLRALRRGVYKRASVKDLTLEEQLDEFPPEILDLGDTLKSLDLTDTGLTSLPANLAAALPKLEILSLSGCGFAVFPMQLAPCPSLVMLNLSRNRMSRIPEGALPPILWQLVLDDNQLQTLPDSIGTCTKLLQLRVTANQLRKLPISLSRCRDLTTIRLCSNTLSHLPAWLFRLPRLASLSLAGNPCSAHPPPDYAPCPPTRSWVYLDNPARKITLSNLSYSRGELGSTCSSAAHDALFRRPHRRRRPERAVLQVFIGHSTLASSPRDELAAHLRAGHHPGLLSPVALFREVGSWSREGGDVEDLHGALVVRPMPVGYRVLVGGRFKPYPSAHCNGRVVKIWQLPVEKCLEMVHSISEVAKHLHGNRVMHGNFVASNVYYDGMDGKVLLVDFWAASIYDNDALEDHRPYIERIEVLAFARLLEEITNLINPWHCYGRVGDPPPEDPQCREFWEYDRIVLDELLNLQDKCSNEDVLERPSFSDIEDELWGLLRGYRAIRDYYMYPLESFQAVRVP